MKRCLGVPFSVVAPGFERIDRERFLVQMDLRISDWPHTVSSGSREMLSEAIITIGDIGRTHEP